MKKIISLFKRDYEGDHLVYDEIVEGAEWVVKGEGIATQKFDGTCCMVKDDKLFKRYDCKNGKIPPNNFIPTQEPDEITGHWPGWVPVKENNPADKYFIEGYKNTIIKIGKVENGTYELCGEKINKNPEGFNENILIPHGNTKLEAPRTYNELKEWFKGRDMEGIVWHHPDGRMVKIKKRDFGLKRKEA